MCLYPRLIQNRKYTKTKKNGGKIPAVTDLRTTKVSVGCQNCIECRKQKAREWQIRLSEDIKELKNGIFVTLTFNTKSLIELSKGINAEGYALDNAIAKKAVRRFLERWRKKHKTSVKHWLVTELGHEGTERIHMHGIIFTNKIDDVKNIWKYGIVHIGQWVNEQTVNYCVKYVSKIDKDHKGYVPKILCSKGLGSNYLKRYDSNINEFKGNKTNEYYVLKNGRKVNLPKYYRNKIYSDEQKEELWINLS